VRLVENHKVVLEQNAARQLLVNAAQQREKQRVIQDQNIRRQNPVPHALKKTDVVVARKIRLVPACFGRAQTAFGTDLRPHFRVRLDLEIRQAAILGLLGPLVDAL
jgi:hypothetical protein